MTEQQGAEVIACLHVLVQAAGAFTLYAVLLLLFKIVRW